jgi:hypothetical protein
MVFSFIGNVLTINTRIDDEILQKGFKDKAQMSFCVLNRNTHGIFIGTE